MESKRNETFGSVIFGKIMIQETWNASWGVIEEATRQGGAPRGWACPLSCGFLDAPLACTPSFLGHICSKNHAAEGFIPFGLRLIFLFFEILKQAIKQQYGLGLRLIG